MPPLLSIPIVDFLILHPGLAEPYFRFSQFQVAFHLILVSSYPTKSDVCCM